MTKRVLLVDDHTMFREALRGLLERTDGFEVVGEASDGSQVEALVERLLPDIVVMDVSMPTLNGIEATRQLLARYPQLKVVALSAYGYKRFVLEMIDAGALGYVTKAGASEELVRAIISAADGKLYVCPEAAAMLAEATRRNGRASATAGVGRDKHTNHRLGRREKEILCLLAEGRTTPQIASALFIAPSTVNVHRRNIMRKVNLHTVAELTRFAIREGLVSV